MAFRVTSHIGILARMKKSPVINAAPKKPKGFHIRMPPGLRERVDEARSRTGRSVNAELVARIEAGLDADEPDLIASIERLRAAVDELNRRLDKQ